MKNLKNFSDLDFSADSDDLKTIRARLQLGDYTVSVVTSLGVERGFSYGTLPSLTFEVAVFDYKGDFVPLSVADDVLGWQSMDQLNYLMAKLQADDVEDWAKVKRAEKLAWQNDTEEDYDNALSYDNALDMED
jgi:hypothetical protein|tara:strand:- start:520 stop:918 length:399 start_codon:yes stop_codon:yes gene_type:complete